MRSAHRLVHAVEHARGVFTPQHQGDALDGIRVVVLSEDALSLRITELHLAQVPDEHGHAVFLRDDDVAEIVEPAYQAHAAHHETLLAAVHDAAARVRVVGIDRLRDLA